MKLKLFLFYKKVFQKGYKSQEAQKGITKFGQVNETRKVDNLLFQASQSAVHLFLFPTNNQSLASCSLLLCLSLSSTLPNKCLNGSNLDIICSQTDQLPHSLPS